MKNSLYHGTWWKESHHDVPIPCCSTPTSCMTYHGRNLIMTSPSPVAAHPPATWLTMEGTSSWRPHPLSQHTLQLYCLRMILLQWWGNLQHDCNRISKSLWNTIWPFGKYCNLFRRFTGAHVPTRHCRYWHQKVPMIYSFFWNNHRTNLATCFCQFLTRHFIVPHIVVRIILVLHGNLVLVFVFNLNVNISPDWFYVRSVTILLLARFVPMFYFLQKFCKIKSARVVC